MAPTLEGIVKYVEERVESISMKAYPLKVGDYNDQVRKNYPGSDGKAMTLHYADNVLAFVVCYNSRKIESYDDAVKLLHIEYDAIKAHFPSLKLKFMDPNEPISNTTAYVSVQTAGNAAGGAFYYQKAQVVEQPAYWKGKEVYGIPIHPDYRLTTEFSGLIIFEDFKSFFQAPSPEDIYRTEEEKIMLLNKANKICPSNFVCAQ